MEPLETPPSPKHRIPGWALPVVIFLVALTLRLCGVSWGLPNELHHQSYHPDEEVIFLYSQQIDLSKGKLTPGFYNYPSLYLEKISALSKVMAAYGGVDPQAPWRFEGRCILAARIIGCFVGAATCLLVFAISRKWLGNLGSSIAALSLTFAPAHVVHSRFQTTDISAMFLACVAIWLTTLNPCGSGKRFSWAADARWKVFAWAGIFAGAAASTKYTWAIVIVPIAYAWWTLSDARPTSFRELGIMVLAMLGTFLATTPGVLLESGKFVQDFKFEMAHTATGHGLLFEGMSGLQLTVANCLDGFGVLLTLLGIVGLVLSAKDRIKGGILLAILFGLYAIVVGRANVQFMRYDLPYFLPLAFGVGYLVHTGDQRRGLGMALPALAIFGLGGSLTRTGMYTQLMMGTDERDRVALKLRAEAQGKESYTVGLVSDPWYYTPPTFVDAAITRMAGPNAYLGGLESSIPKTVRYLPEDVNQRYDWDTRLITELKPDVIVFSNFEVGPVARLSETKGLKDQVIVDRFLAFQKLLTEKYQLEGSVGDLPKPRDLYQAAYSGVEDMRYVAPIIYVWHRKP